MKKNISPFKPHLVSPAPSAYRGGKSKAEVQSEKRLYKLSSNENLLGASPKALAAIRAHIDGLNEYPERTGASLSVALSEFYENELTPDQFITANSGVGIFDLLVAAFLGPELECIVCPPTFPAYKEFSQKSGAEVVEVPFRGDAMGLDIEGILHAITDQTRLIWLSNPNNPTGTYIPTSQVSQLIAHLPEHVVLVHDEVYRQFAQAEDYETAESYVLAGKKVVGLNSFSKAYGLAGLRIGYAYSTPEIARYVNPLRRPFFLNTLSLEAAKAALKDTEFIQQTQQLIAQEKAFLYQELDQLNVHYWKSQTNFLLIRTGMEGKLFEEKMLEHGIMVRPTNSPLIPDSVRVTIGTREANEAFMEGLKAVLK